MSPPNISLKKTVCLLCKPQLLYFRYKRKARCNPAHALPNTQRTSIFLAGDSKDYHSDNKVRMPLFGNLEEIFYKPFENLPPTDLLLRLIRNPRRIMRVGLLRGE